MKRRELVLLVGGAALLHAPIGRAQEPGRVYRLGIMTGLPREDAIYTALFDELRRSGLSKVKTCWSSADSLCAKRRPRRGRRCSSRPVLRQS
jgi:hypothetical protein